MAWVRQGCGPCDQMISFLWLYYFIFLPFHTVHGVLKARILKWFAIPFFSGPCFVRTLHHELSVLGGPTLMAHGWVRKAVVHVISLISFLWLWISFCLPSDGITDSLDVNLSKLKIVKDRGAWRATVHVVAKSWTRLSHWRTAATTYNIIVQY